MNMRKSELILPKQNIPKSSRYLANVALLKLLDLELVLLSLLTLLQQKKKHENVLIGLSVYNQGTGKKR